MSYAAPERFANVTVTCKANVYFDGRVVSHAVTLADGSCKTLGLIYPGSYRFNTAAAEKMEIIAGNCTGAHRRSGGMDRLHRRNLVRGPGQLLLRNRR